MNPLRQVLEALRRYPSAAAGATIIAGLVILAVYTVIALPYGEAIRLWRGGEEVWIENPKNALPAWVNLLPGRNLPETLVLSTRDGAAKTVRTASGGLREVEISLAFDYQYDDFPSELSLFLDASYEERRPYVSAFWRTPDGREIDLMEGSVRASERYSISQDRQLRQTLGGRAPEVGLFTDPSAPDPVPLRGRYELIIDGLLFEKDADLDAKLVVYGKVYGVAGTDHRRRDITVALLWGTPIALVFGLLAAVGSTVSTLIIAAIGVWFGGRVDAVIQRITEVNAILPVLSILILVGTFYSRSIWVILGVVIALGVFSIGIKFYRAIFLQVKESPYIEAARAYGAGDMRIVFRYMIPKALPVLIPGFVTLIPSFVFLEASLAVLGLGDPVLPTWGKVLNDANQNGALYLGYYYWVLEPAVLLMLTGLGFALVGFALDRIFNPRLRGL